jgi:hypothetical protein
MPPRRWWPIASAVTAIAVAVSLLLPAGRHQWALSIFRQPARYTALAFKYAWLLPTTEPSHHKIPLFFTITNQEGRRLKYRYIIIQTIPRKRLGHGDQTVQSGATWTVDTKVKPTCTLVCKVEVILPGHPETIDFSLSPPNGVAASGN